jgi:hypothetical protein
VARIPQIRPDERGTKKNQLKIGAGFPKQQKILAGSSLFKVSLLFDRYEVTDRLFRENVKKMS